jgi:hypothetical protein
MTGGNGRGNDREGQWQGAMTGLALVKAGRVEEVVEALVEGLRGRRRRHPPRQYPWIPDVPNKSGVPSV